MSCPQQQPTTTTTTTNSLYRTLSTGSRKTPQPTLPSTPLSRTQRITQDLTLLSKATASRPNLARTTPPAASARSYGNNYNCGNPVLQSRTPAVSALHPSSASSYAPTPEITRTSSNLRLASLRSNRCGEQPEPTCAQPAQINETEEITVNGERGIWANKAESQNWRGPIPLDQYPLNQDSNPEVVTKKACQNVDYVQEVGIRYLRPPTPPAPGEIVIKEDPSTVPVPAPPLVIRQQPARADTPEPLVIREAPPQPPAQVGRKVITISGKRLPPPPRKVIIERLPKIPSKPQGILVERWLPYSTQKRRVIYQKAECGEPQVVKPRNVIIQWEAPRANVRKEIKYLGVIRANPADYVQRYGSQLRTSQNLPPLVNEIKTPEGLTLAADYRSSDVYELEGDVQALALVDLQKEGLSEYRSQVQRFASGNTSRLAQSNEALLRSSSFLAPTGSAAGLLSASRTSPQQIEQILSTLNRSSDNRISREEAERVLLALNSRLGRAYGETDVNAFFGQLDQSGSGDATIDYEDFRRLLLA